MRSKLALSLIFSVSLYAALPATTVWEMRPSVGNDTNGGCFDSAMVGTGTDYSQQNSSQYSGTNLAITATNTIVSSATHNFVTADVGNCLHISAGTNFTTGWYEIISVASNNATLDRAAGTASSSGGTFTVGGALLTPTQLNTNMSSGHSAYIKASGNISLTAQFAFTFANPGANQYSAIIGYTSARGDNGKVTWQATSGYSGYLVDIDVEGATMQNFIFNCNSQTGVRGFILDNSRTRGINIIAENCASNYAIDFNSGIGDGCYFCTATGSVLGFMFGGTGSMCFVCYAYTNTGAGFSDATESSIFTCNFCVAYNNTGAGSDGFLIEPDVGTVYISNSVAYGNGRDGFRFTSVNLGNITSVNNISYNNGAYGANYTNGALSVGGQVYWNCNAYGANATAARNNVPVGANDVTLSTNPFVSVSGNNFALTTAAAAILGAAGCQGVTPFGTGYLTIGALQPQGSTAGQVGYPIVQ